jgi:hypothetical protein
MQRAGRSGSHWRIIQSPVADRLQGRKDPRIQPHHGANDPILRRGGARNPPRLHINVQVAHFCANFAKERKKVLTSPADQCDKRSMFMRLRQALAQTTEGRKVLVAVRDRLLDVNLSLVLVLIILVLIAQSGEGLAV